VGSWLKHQLRTLQELCGQVDFSGGAWQLVGAVQRFHFTCCLHLSVKVLSNHTVLLLDEAGTVNIKNERIILDVFNYTWFG